MSQFTSYNVIHFENLNTALAALSGHEISSVLLTDYNHPLFNAQDLVDRWCSLDFKDKWLILMTTDEPAARQKIAPSLSVSLTSDEIPGRWELRMHNRTETKVYLFSDVASMDRDIIEEGMGGVRIETADDLSGGDLKFFEAFFRVKRTQFMPYLNAGPGYAMDFLRSVGLPTIRMLCDWLFYYPEEGRDRCILWPEYNRLTFGYIPQSGQKLSGGCDRPEDDILPIG